MDQKLLSTVDTDESLVIKIQRLEAELASARQLLNDNSERSTKVVGKDQQSTLSMAINTPALNLDNQLNCPRDRIFAQEWLTRTLKYLFDHQYTNNIQRVLADIGDLLRLYEVSVWRWDEHEQQLTILEQWVAPTISEENQTILQQGLWLRPLLLSVSPSSAQLRKGIPLQLKVDGSDTEQTALMLRRLDIYDSLIIPCCEQTQLHGLMVLHRYTSGVWNPEDISALQQLLAWLFSFMQQREQLQLLADRDVRYQYAMDATNDGLWDWDLRTNKIYFSRSYLRLLGYAYEALPGDLETLKEYFVHPDDVAELLLEYQTAIENRRESLQLQFRMLHRDGNYLWVRSKAKFFEPDAQGRATRCVGVNTDITDFISSHEELLHAKAQADLANKIKSEFLARVSHELRTPMNAIIGLGYLIHDTVLDTDQQSYLTSLNSAADSLLQIINQLLDFSKIETGRVILEHAHFDLEQLFEKMSRLFEISAGHRAIHIVYDIQPDTPRFLRGDASRLSQVLGHLVSNSLQHSDSDQVVVKVRKLGVNSQQVLLEFCVEDAGIGIESAKLAQLQEQLKVTHHSHEAEKNICGLGICSHLIHLMDGSMTIESMPNEGCTVIFSACFEHSHLSERALLPYPLELKNMRVLIVDDNAIARTIIASTARSIRLHADEAMSPIVAIEKIRQADKNGIPYHFVLLDYRMPIMSGLQLTGLIKSDQSLKNKPYIFLISAYHRDEISGTDPNAMLVDEFLSKPVSESRLFDAISQAIGREHLFQDHNVETTTLALDMETLNEARILVVEDNIVNQQVICGILKKKNMHSVVAANGVEAVRCIEFATRPFDAVLMDLEMPEMDGLEATRQIRSYSHQQDVPIIAVTAQAMRGDRERCLTAGMNGYLSKPVNPELLYSTLADMLRNKKLHIN